MKIKKPIAAILIGVSLGLIVGAVLEYASAGVTFPFFLILGAGAGLVIAVIVEIVRHRRLVTDRFIMDKAQELARLPASVAEFVKLVIKKMRYRKKVRAEVMAELVAHFEDELHECKSDEERQQKAGELITHFGDTKLLGVLLRRAKKRCRPFWRTVFARAFQTIGALILCFIVYCVYISLGQPAITVNYLDEMIRITRPVADEGLNAAPLYQKAFDSYKEPPKIGTRKEPWFDAIKGKDRVADLSEEEVSALKKWLSDNADSVRFFRQASEKPHCWWRRKAEDDVVLKILMPELATARDLVRMLAWQAKLKAYDGDIKGAFDDLLMCYRAGWHFKGPRMLIDQLVGIAMQALALKNAAVVLQNRAVDGQTLKTFQTELAKLVTQDTHVVSYEAERFYALDFIQRCYTDSGTGSGHMIPGRIEELLQLLEAQERTADDVVGKVASHGRALVMALTSADRLEMTRAFEEVYRTGRQWGRKSPWQLRQEKVDPEMGLEDWSFFKQVRYWPVTIFMPAVARVSELAYRSKTESEALISIIAILRYKQDMGGYPESLEQLLRAGYITALPADPYSDGPLVYRMIDDGFTLYSVGENFADDSGERYRSSWGSSEKGDKVFWPLETYQQRERRRKKERHGPVRLIRR